MIFLEFNFFLYQLIWLSSLCMISFNILLDFVCIISYFKHHKNYKTTIIVHNISLFNTSSLFALTRFLKNEFFYVFFEAADLF